MVMDKEVHMVVCVRYDSFHDTFMRKQGQGTSHG